jgi:hypothetical protein
MCGVDLTIEVTTIGFDMKDLSTAPSYDDFGGYDPSILASQSWWPYSVMNYPDRCA